MSVESNADLIKELRKRLDAARHSGEKAQIAPTTAGAMPSGIIRGTLENQPVDKDRSERLWSKFESSHDVSQMTGMFAGIEPDSGNVWVGKQIGDVLSQRNAAGIETPLYWKRIGCAAFVTRVGRRWFRES